MVNCIDAFHLDPYSLNFSLIKMVTNSSLSLTPSRCPEAITLDTLCSYEPNPQVGSRTFA